MDISKLVLPNIKRLIPYKAYNTRCKVKLDANESPFCPDIEIPLSTFTSINRYPDPEAKELKKAAAKAHNVSVDNVLFGNGSDELIYYIITTFGGTVLYPIPTFSMYGIIAQSLQHAHKGIPLDKNFDIDINPMLSAIKSDNPKIIFLSSPNNPTGNCFDYEKMLKILNAAKGIVVIDEAYQLFSNQKSFVPLIKQYNNLIVLRSLSKIGLAGLRTGYMIASKEVVAEVNKVRLPFNLNIISQACAAECIKNIKTLLPHIDEIKNERTKIYNALSAIKGIQVFPSDSNFILFKATNAVQIHQRLLKQGVLIRLLHPAVKNSLRVTVATKIENDFFINAIQKAV